MHKAHPCLSACLLVVIALSVLLTGCAPAAPAPTAKPAATTAPAAAPATSVPAAPAATTKPAATAAPAATTAPAAPTAAPAAKIADQIVFASSTDIVTLDPQDLTDNTSEQIIKMIHNTLVKFDEKMNIVGDLAESWTVSADGKTWAFKLKKGIKFQDGTPLNAEAVRKSFARMMDTSLKLKRTQLIVPMVQSVKAPEEYTFEISTQEPFGAFLATMAHDACGIVQADAAAKLGKDYYAHPIGTGPYKFVSWKKDTEVVLERNDDYFGTKGPTKRIVYRPITDAVARVTALETGEVDAISHVPDADLERLEKNPKLTVEKVLSNGQRQFRWNLTMKPFDDVRVRQAMSYAIDRQAIVDQLFSKTAVASTGPLSPVTFGYYNFGVVKRDVAKAKQLLADAGYPNGFDMTIATTERYVQGRQLAEAIGAQLKDVGIKAKIDVMEWGTIVAQWGGLKPADMKLGFFIMGAGPSTNDADWGMRPIYQTSPTNTNENNYGYYSNATFDKLITQGMQTTDQEKRKDIYKQAGEIVYQTDPVAIWIYDQYWIIAHKKELKDLTMSPLALVLFDKAHLDK